MNSPATTFSGADSHSLTNPSSNESMPRNMIGPRTNPPATLAGTLTSDALPKVFEFERMVGVPRPYTGTANAIRGVNGGGLPWVVGKAEAKLRLVSETATSLQGMLKVEVEGLVRRVGHVLSR